jgi:hypothetical protein
MDAVAYSFDPQFGFITRDELVRTNAAMLALTSIFVLSRAAVQISKRRTFELADAFIYFSYILYVALW